jgi:hypothetical protein
MPSYPIWNDITSCAYKNQNKSYGIKAHGENTVYIGTSPKNSHLFVETKLTHRLNSDGTRTYHFYLDNELIKKATLNKDRTGASITRYRKE